MSGDIQSRACVRNVYIIKYIEANFNENSNSIEKNVLKRHVVETVVLHIYCKVTLGNLNSHPFFHDQLICKFSLKNF